MQLSLETMLFLLKKRTHLTNDDPYLVSELNSAADWAYNEVMVMNQDILKEEDEQFTLAAQTSSYNLGAAVSRPDMYAIKWLGVKFSSDTKFNPVQFMDSSSAAFMSADQDSAATSSPVFCDTKNFNQVRFAPPLPAGAQVMVSYIWIGLPFSLDTNAALTSSTYPGIPNPLNQAIVDKATAQVMVELDDTRGSYYDGQAMIRLRSALNVINRRQLQQRPTIKGFRRRAGRRMF